MAAVVEMAMVMAVVMEVVTTKVVVEVMEEVVVVMAAAEEDMAEVEDQVREIVDVLLLHERNIGLIQNLQMSQVNLNR